MAAPARSVAGWRVARRRAHRSRCRRPESWIPGYLLKSPAATFAASENAHSGPAEHARLVIQQPFLERQSAAVADQRPTRADHPVAGDDDGDRVAAIGGADGPRGTRPADPPGLLRIADGRAEGDGQERVPGKSLEGCAGHAERQVERRSLAGEVCAQLLDRARNGALSRRQPAPASGAGAAVPERQVEAGQGLAVGGQHELADGAGIVAVPGGGRLRHGRSPGMKRTGCRSTRDTSPRRNARGARPRPCRGAGVPRRRRPP